MKSDGFIQSIELTCLRHVTMAVREKPGSVRVIGDWLAPETPAIGVLALLETVVACPSVLFYVRTQHPHAWRERVQVAHDSLYLSNSTVACRLSEWLDEDDRPSNLIELESPKPRSPTGGR